MLPLAFYVRGDIHNKPESVNIIKTVEVIKKCVIYFFVCLYILYYHRILYCSSSVLNWAVNLFMQFVMVTLTHMFIKLPWVTMITFCVNFTLIRPKKVSTDDLLGLKKCIDSFFNRLRKISFKNLAMRKQEFVLQ